MKGPLCLIVALAALTSCDRKSESSNVGSKELPETSSSARSHGSSAGTTSLDVIRTKRLARAYRTPNEATSYQNAIINLSTADLTELIRETSDNRKSGENILTFSTAIAELASRDPDAALSWFKPEAMEVDEAGWFGVAQVLSQNDPETLKNWISQNLTGIEGKAQASCLAYSLMSLSTTDAASTLAFVKQLKTGVLPNSEIISAIFFQYGKQSPLDAEKAAASLYAGAELDLARSYIVTGAFENGPEAALAAAKGISDPSQRGDSVAGVISRIFDRNEEAGIVELRKLNEVELGAVLQRNLGADESLVQKLGKSNPGVLVEALGKIVPSEENQSVFRAAVEALGPKNMALADKLIESMPDSDLKKDMIGEKFTIVASDDLALALGSATKLSDKRYQTEALGKIGNVAGQSGFDATLDASKNLSAPEKQTFVEGAMPFLIAKNPMEAVKMLELLNSDLNSQARKDIISGLGASIVVKDVSFTKSWLGGLSAGDGKLAMRGIAGQMARTDVKGLSELLSNVPQDEKWEEGVRVLVSNIRGSDPEMARKWEQSLDDTK